MTEVTRIRIEARGETKEDVEARLLECVEELCKLYAPPWKIDRQEVQHARAGHWGYVILVRPPA